MNEIEVKGHSGCDISLQRENRELFVYKSTTDPKYFDRLVLQAEKQKTASLVELQHIRVPKIHQIERSQSYVRIKMDYVYSRNFVEFFEQAGFEQIHYLIDALIKFIDYEISLSPLTVVKQEIVADKFKDVKNRILANIHLSDDQHIKQQLEHSQSVFNSLGDMEMPIGTCHGDLTFSNILFNGNNYFLIDFLDSFIESPLLDIVKIRQDTAWLWSQLMYVNPCDSVRLRIAFNKIDRKLDAYFASRYKWYVNYYKPLQLMNFLRILQYAHEPNVIEYIKLAVDEQLKEF